MDECIRLGGRIESLLKDLHALPADCRELENASENFAKNAGLWKAAIEGVRKSRARISEIEEVRKFLNSQNSGHWKRRAMNDVSSIFNRLL